MEEHFIGLDTSLNGCALTVLSRTRVVYAGSLQLNGSVRGGARLELIHGFLSSHMPKTACSAAIEAPSLNSVHREFDLGEVSGVAKRLVYGAYAIECVPVPPKRLKLYTTGSGDADKAAMIHAVKREWGHDAGEDDDEADSFALAHLARALRTGPGARRCEVQVVHDILHPGAGKARVKHRRSKENI